MRVRNAGVPADWSGREVLRLGSVSGAESAPDQFGRIAGVIADDAGLVYVADAIASEIRVFDREGGLIRTLGRAGAGPGASDA